MWRELAAGAYPEAEFAPPVTDTRLAEAERRLSQPLPADLRALLQETDGIAGMWATDTVWPLERIVADNLGFRSHPDFPALYRPFDGLVFFGDNGGGDQFAFQAGTNGPVVVWEHETDERRPVAGDLRDYLLRSLPCDSDEWYEAVEAVPEVGTAPIDHSSSGGSETR